MEKKTMTFEEASARLEEIVKSMENGKIPLAESLALFEEGVSLVRLCNDMLDSAEQKVAVLTDDGQGGKVEKDFVGEDK